MELRRKKSNHFVEREEKEKRIERTNRNINAFEVRFSCDSREEEKINMKVA